MIVQKNSVVTLDYTVRDTQENIIDEGLESLIYLHGGYGDLFVALEEALDGKSKGESVSVLLTADNAFGDYNADLVLVEDRSAFDDDIFVGEHLEGPAEDDEEATLVYTITNITDDEVTLDANHPLAGMDVTFEATVLDIRVATEEEIDHGHVHVDGVHDHD